MQIKRDLNPVLRKGERFNLNSVQEEVKSFLTEILAAKDEEKLFWKNFAEGNYRPELIFDRGIPNIEKHPMALWKCRKNNCDYKE